MRAARTKGDSACGVHALFGAPHGSVAPQLVVAQPRVLAASMLGPSLEALVSAGAPETHLKAITASFWTEFVVPYMNGAEDPEPQYFMEALETNAPNLAQEAQEINFVRHLESIAVPSFETDVHTHAAMLSDDSA